MKFKNIETAEDVFTGFENSVELEKNIDGIEDKLWQLKKQIKTYKADVEKLEKETNQLKDFIFKLLFELI